MAAISTTSETLTATTAAKVAHDEHARSGRLRLTANAGVRHIGRRRTPAMPRVSMENGKPTPEREAQAPEGIDRASGSGARRVNCPLERYFRHLGSELVQVGNWYINLHRAMEKRLTPAWTGLPVQAGDLGARSGGVDDDERANATALAFVEAQTGA